MKKIKLLANGMLLTLVSSIAFGVTQAATLSFVSPTETLTKDCPAQIDVMINTEGEEVNSADFVLVTNDTFVLNEINTTDGVFRTYTQPTATTAKEGDFKGKNVVRLVATTASANGFNGDGKFLSLTITPTTDNVNLELYAIDGFAGDDTNLAVVKDGKAKDALTKALPITYKVVEGSCTVAPLEALTLEKAATTVMAEKIENVVEDTTNLNEENIFDTTQDQNFFEANWLYIAIGVVVLIVIILAIKPKKNGKEKK